MDCCCCSERCYLAIAAQGIAVVNLLLLTAAAQSTAITMRIAVESTAVRLLLLDHCCHVLEYAKWLSLWFHKCMSTAFLLILNHLIPSLLPLLSSCSYLRESNKYPDHCTYSNFFVNFFQSARYNVDHLFHGRGPNTWYSRVYVVLNARHRFSSLHGTPSFKS